MTNETLFKIKNEINENKILSKLIEEYPVEEMLNFNEFNVGDKLKDNAYKIEQFRLMYISEKNKYCKLENKYNEEMGKKYDYYKYDSAKDLSKVEIEKYYLQKDPDIIKLKRMLQLQEIRVNFFETLADAFKGMGYNMKNFIENLKIGG